MAAWLLCLLLQDPRLDELLRDFDAQGVAEPADLDELLAALEALGATALLPISEALAMDLRDGLAAASAPALVDALVGHADKLEPLRAAFRDPKTPPAGRLEIARALDDLGDTSWREEVRKLAGGADPELRRKALALLELAEEPKETVVPLPAPRVSVARKKAERPPAPPSILGAALFIGGSLMALGILLWTLRRKD